MSRFSFRLRRSERKSFKHIAHGLIPAATIAPRPAVPRTPPPRSPDPSPERSRSALAAAILSSSLTGRTFAIPPPRNRSFSESDCSNAGSHAGFEPDVSTALYTRDRFPDTMADHDDDEEEEETEEDLERDESHVYQSLERHSRAGDIEAVYAEPLKGSNRSRLEEDTDNSTFEIVSPLNTEDETEVEEGTSIKKPPLPLQTRSPFQRSLPSPDLKEDPSASSPKYPTSSTPKRKTSVVSKSPIRDGEKDQSEGSEAYGRIRELQEELAELRGRNLALTADKEATERRCSEQSRQILLLQQQCLQQSPRERKQNTGESSELLSLRQQAQELVDENDGLKLTVHRLNVELSRYQAHFRPLTKEEHSRSSGLPGKGPAPPWLLDMKYLSPLLLAYEDQLTERDQLLKTCEEEVKKLRLRAEEVIQENEKLHAELGKKNSVGNKEWRQMQDQARLVLEENQVLIEQLELQHVKAKETHSKHTQEVCKVSKQVMLLEAEKQSLEVELDAVRKELSILKMELQKARSALENSVSRAEHASATDKLERQFEEEDRKKNRELEVLQDRLGVLQAENKTLVLEKNDLNAHIKHLESNLQQARQTNRKAQKRIDLLKQRLEESLEKELADHQHLSSIVMLAEKTTHERDQLIQMASCLDKQGALNRMLDETVRLGRLQKRIKGFKHQASASVGALSQRLCEQEQDFAGKVASFQREIRHLQAQLRERQEQLNGALQQKRQVEKELEVVWEAATRETQHIKDTMMGGSEFHSSPPESRSSLAWLSPENHHRTRRQKPNSPMFKSDSEQQHNPSSDESERNE